MATRALTTVLLIAAAAAAIGSVLLSPWALSLIDRRSDANWEQLSFVGQTYGAASAILAVALRMRAEQGRRARRFQRIVDEEYRRAVASGPPEPTVRDPAASTPPTRPHRRAATVAVATAGLVGVLVGWSCRHAYHRPRLAGSRAVSRTRSPGQVG